MERKNLYDMGLPIVLVSILHLLGDANKTSHPAFRHATINLRTFGEWGLEQKFSTQCMIDQPISVLPNLQIVTVHTREVGTQPMIAMPDDIYHFIPTAPH
jgi:hypothetical protein